MVSDRAVTFNNTVAGSTAASPGDNVSGTAGANMTQGTVKPITIPAAHDVYSARNQERKKKQNIFLGALAAIALTAAGIGIFTVTKKEKPAMQVVEEAVPEITGRVGSRMPEDFPYLGPAGGGPAPIAPPHGGRPHVRRLRGPIVVQSPADAVVPHVGRLRRAWRLLVPQPPVYVRPRPGAGIDAATHAGVPNNFHVNSFHFPHDWSMEDISHLVYRMHLAGFETTPTANGLNQLTQVIETQHRHGASRARLYNWLDQILYQGLGDHVHGLEYEIDFLLNRAGVH